MKHLVLTVSLAFAPGLALAGESAPAQDPSRGMHGGQPPWLNEVGLTDEQREEMRKIREAGGGREEIKAVLTPEQQAKIRELKGARMGQGPKAHGMGDMEHLQRRLDLSDEQVAEMKDIREKGGSRQEMLEVLTPEQREQIKARKGHGKGHGAPRGPAQETPPA